MNNGIRNLLRPSRARNLISGGVPRGPSPPAIHAGRTTEVFPRASDRSVGSRATTFLPLWELRRPFQLVFGALSLCHKQCLEQGRRINALQSLGVWE